MRLARTLVVVLLSGCAAATPAPVTFGRGAPAAVAKPEPAPVVRAAPAAKSAPRPVPAAPAPDWAAGPGTPLSAWALRPEEAAPFDPAHLPRTHRVGAGETLFALSVRYQIPLRPLIEANRLDAPFRLEVGQVLTLPPPRLHRVRRGETLLSLARRYNIDARSLALLNRLPKPYVVNVGDMLALPALARGEQDPAPAALPPAGPSRFAWPLSGTILARFGPQAGGRRSDGVDIAGAEGAPVKATADGRVVYAGDDLAAYGKLMLVQHADGWVSAYAHCRAFAAKEGERVRAGQKIAEVGKAADGAAKLHFQLRRGSAPTDPLAALPPV
jgi:murein DD-endopeptidase MepM/ murein hydrolase activator NlpD